MMNLPNPFFFDATATAPSATATAPSFDLDEASFMAEIEAPPAFLGNPSPEYLDAAELMPILEVLAGHAQRRVRSPA